MYLKSDYVFPHMLSGHNGGWGIMYLDLYMLMSMSGGMPGYGLLPNVTISHNNTPYDQTSLHDVNFPLDNVSGLIHLYGNLPC